MVSDGVCTLMDQATAQTALSQMAKAIIVNGEMQQDLDVLAEACNFLEAVGGQHAEVIENAVFALGDESGESETNMIGVFRELAQVGGPGETEPLIFSVMCLINTLLKTIPSFNGEHSLSDLLRIVVPCCSYKSPNMTVTKDWASDIQRTSLEGLGLCAQAACRASQTDRNIFFTLWQSFGVWNVLYGLISDGSDSATQTNAMCALATAIDIPEQSFDQTQQNEALDQLFSHLPIKAESMGQGLQVYDRLCSLAEGKSDLVTSNVAKWVPLYIKTFENVFEDKFVETVPGDVYFETLADRAQDCLIPSLCSLVANSRLQPGRIRDMATSLQRLAETVGRVQAVQGANHCRDDTDMEGYDGDD